MSDTYITSLPVVLAALSGILILILDLSIKKAEKIVFFFSILFSILIPLPAFLFYGLKTKAFSNQLLADSLSYIFLILISTISLFIILISFSYNKRREVRYNEFYALLFFANAGLISIVSSYNLLVLFLSFEIFSFSSYVLTGIVKDRLSSEASFKYIYTGIISSSVGLLGIAFIYGTSGSLYIDKIILNGNYKLGLVAGFILFLINIFFKFSIVPFHIWTPDVYEGAPTPISAYFSVAPKLAVIIFIIRLININFLSLMNFQTLIWILSAATILWGNLAALKQRNLKRIMAYSAIAHSGYISMGFLLPFDLAYKYLIFYSVSYIFLNLSAFTFLSYLTSGINDDAKLENISGFSQKRPFESFVFTLALISLAGFPPTIGFFAKFYLFIALIKQGFLYITLIAVLGTVISVFYYFRIIMYLYFKEGGKEYGFDIWGRIVLFLNMIIILFLSFYPEIIFKILRG